jgi:hypothetical protein
MESSEIKKAKKVFVSEPYHENVQKISDYFERLRLDVNHHLGLGDIRLTMAQQGYICGLALKNVESQLPTELMDFIADVEYMQEMYSRGSYTRAEGIKDKLAERLDDLMRMGSYASDTKAG